MTLIQEETQTIVGQIKPEKPTSKEWARPLGFLFTVGWYVALSLIIPSGIGYWLDRPEMWNRQPLFTIIGLGVGTVVAFYGLFRMLRQFKAEQDALNKSKK